MDWNAMVSMQNKQPLIQYVIGVAIVRAIILSAMWYSGDVKRLHMFTAVCGGFMLGMLAMYIAVHIYRWK